ncbi:hypothetical protein PAXRUDRAFT_824224 [Paxillus rubicundulus Ve08.2h10]|uniref:Uncharacterized protein n=1 Tax=Paxillus rubicundulus Ve08.2h10 TaxID=930991 RepID=A0A0D0EBS8_9AGAM|nr:hypothetical protein PAXRUDRAFT_824224 [Paxillus rubicundulus Ve08.2h10]
MAIHVPGSHQLLQCHYSMFNGARLIDHAKPVSRSCFGAELSPFLSRACDSRQACRSRRIDTTRRSTCPHDDELGVPCLRTRGASSKTPPPLRYPRGSWMY